LLIGIKYRNLILVTGRPVTKGKNKITTTPFYNKPNGSKDYKNLCMTVILPERACKNDKGFRRFDYDNIISMEVES